MMLLRQPLRQQFRRLSTTIEQLKSRISGAGGFMAVHENLVPISADEGRVQCELKVEDLHLNPGGFVHGGLTATLIDSVTTMACMTTGDHKPGVSVDLNVTYLKPIPLHDVIIIDAWVDRIGKSLAFTSSELRRKSDNELVALGRHTKAFPGSSKK